MALRILQVFQNCGAAFLKRFVGKRKADAPVGDGLQLAADRVINSIQPDSFAAEIPKVRRDAAKVAVSCN